MHTEFLTAGSQVILDNTFGTTEYRLKTFGHEGRTAEIARRAVGLAQEVRSAARYDAALAWSVGPSGEFFELIDDAERQSILNAARRRSAPAFRLALTLSRSARLDV